MLIPFILETAILERKYKGRFTGYHWRKEFRNWLKTEIGRNWLNCEVKRKADIKYIKQMLKEIK